MVFSERVNIYFFGLDLWLEQAYYFLYHLLRAMDHFSIGNA